MQLRMLRDSFSGLLSNKYAAFAFIALVLFLSYYIAPGLWRYIVSALITYFAATLVFRYSLEKGILKTRRIGRISPAEGHAFVLFVFIIIAATFLSSLLTGYLDSLFSQYSQDRLIVVLAQTLIILALLLLDMKSEL